MCVCGGGGGGWGLQFYIFFLFSSLFAGIKYLQIFTSLLCFFSPALLNNSRDE